MNKKLIHLAEMMGIRTNNVYYLVAKLELILQLPTRILPIFARFFAILIPGFFLHVINLFPNIVYQQYKVNVKQVMS